MIIQSEYLKHVQDTAKCVFCIIDYALPGLLALLIMFTNKLHTYTHALGDINVANYCSLLPWMLTGIRNESAPFIGASLVIAYTCT